MDEESCAVELPASDWHSVLSILKTVIEAEKADMDGNDTEIVDTLILLYEEIDQQLEATDGDGHAHGLYSTTDDTGKQSPR